MQNHLHLIILNQEINTNTKSLIQNHYYITNSTSTVLPKRNYNNRKSQKDRNSTYDTLVDNYEKLSFVLVMYALLNQVAFFISSKLFMRTISFQRTLSLRSFPTPSLITLPLQ